MIGIFFAYITNLLGPTFSRNYKVYFWGEWNNQFTYCHMSFSVAFRYTAYFRKRLSVH